LVLATPCNIYTNAFSQVFYQKLSFVYNHERGEFRKYLRKSIRGTILLATLPFLLFTIYSKDLVVLIFGIKWAGVVPYFYILAPIVYLNLVITPLGNVMKILNKQYVSLMLSFVSSLFKILTIILLGAIILKGPIVALSVFSMISCLVGVITAGIIMKHANIGFLNEVTCIVPFLGMYFYKFIYQLLIKA
jgi:O-antigen/teichoic acid export membrane protein